MRLRVERVIRARRSLAGVGSRRARAGRLKVGWARAERWRPDRDV